MSPGGSRRTKAPWLLLLLAPLASLSPVQEETGNVGCLFSDLVCADDELCFNDQVIGRCVSASSHHLTRPAPLGAAALGLLEAEMTRVFGLGFSWPDIYTQCVFQTLLHDIHTRQRYSEQQCAQLETAQRMIPAEEEGDGEIPEEVEDEETPDINIVLEDADGNIYIPRNSLQYFEEPTEDMEEDLNDEEEEEEEPSEELRQYYPAEEDEEEEEEMTQEEQARAWLELQQVVQAMQAAGYDNNLPEEEQEPMVLVAPEDLELGDDYMMPPYMQYSDQQQYPAPRYIDNNNNHPLEKRETASSYNLINQPPNLDYIIDPEDTEYNVPELYENLYKTLPQNYEHFDDSDIDDQELSEEDDDSAKEEIDYETDEEDSAPSANINKRQVDPKLMQELYDTEETDAEPNVSSYDFDYKDSAADTNDEPSDEILYYDPDSEPIPVESVFDRRERLDVKKPGPFFTNSPNNFFLDKLLPEDDYNGQEEQEEDGQTEYEQSLSPQTRPKKDMRAHTLLTIPEPKPQDNTLTIHYNRLHLEAQADHLVKFVAKHLNLAPSAFSIAKQPESSRLVLTVHANPRGLNASTMADILNTDSNLADHANRDLGIDISSFEAGNKDDVLSVATSHHRSQLLLIILIAVSGFAALLSFVGVIYIIKRKSKKKTDTNEDDSSDDKEEPVKEYKQLVRDWSRSSRASQGSVSNTGGAEAGQASPIQSKRVHKISQNSEGSRTSSTSSWQEEPTATSMDISTGHMVLSYMEDHLKNKQRLEQEWVGLCAYEAEPNSTSIAFKVENKKKNRYPDKLPYDHNRVLLNALVNGTNSDYINASTVMDHDPRNPAYIVTQGPLAHTVADFWQMVWEQGSVVIVMLSRLSENGYQLVQRYWPEEGSEQYHIFEVHLVSEHVWCEDYLVRSLYLKNSQTGETRTVTQFHFLSWPDATIPTSTRAILEFRRKVNKSYRGRSCPMIIHCSDGVGRAGTYVLIDMVLNRMTKGSKEIDIAATLEHIRDQRSGMVQTRSQFEFCLMAVAEETHAILKALPQ